MKQIDLMTEATAIKIWHKTGLTSSPLKLPASATGVLGAAADVISGLATGGEEQSGSIPYAAVGIAKRDVVRRGIHHPDR